jgi:hypothetical protein
MILMLSVSQAENDKWEQGLTGPGAVGRLHQVDSTWVATGCKLSRPSMGVVR